MTTESALRRHLCILDVGHGNCAIVVTGVETVVIDVGRRNALPEVLHQQGIERIRSIYLSHADQDHIGALVGLLASNQVSIDRVVVNTDSLKDTRVWDDLAYELDLAHKACDLEFCIGLVEGHEVTLNEVAIRVLGPSRYLAAKGVGGRDRAGRKITSNSVSAIVRVSFAGQHVALLPADLDDVGLDALLESDADLQAPILVFPHHGGRRGVSDVRLFAKRLLEAVAPSVVVFSIGRGSYGTPNPEIVDVVRECLPDARIICTELSEHCSRKVPSRAPSHLSDVFSLGQAERACCGGTVVVPLDDVGEIRPKGVEHRDFIGAHVETPLCLSGL